MRLQKNASSNTSVKTAYSHSKKPYQHQRERPGKTAPMKPHPKDRMDGYFGSGKLEDKVAIVTGGDSGIGRAVSIAFAKEGANVVIVYLNEREDALVTKQLVEAAGRKALLLEGDVGRRAFCETVVKKVLENFNHIDILVNNAGEQNPHSDIAHISDEELFSVFRTNIFSMFFMSQLVLPHLKAGAAIVNTASVTAYKGNSSLIDYSATKGAIVSFTRSLALSLAPRKIRVNAVAPGPIWTPLIPSTFDPAKVHEFGSDVPIGRAGEPDEVAPAFIYLASNDSSYVTGQVIHVNGGTIVNG